MLKSPVIKEWESYEKYRETPYFDEDYRGGININWGRDDIRIEVRGFIPKTLDDILGYLSYFGFEVEKENDGVQCSLFQNYNDEPRVYKSVSALVARNRGYEFLRLQRIEERIK